MLIADSFHIMNMHISILKVQLSEKFPGKEEMELSIKKLEKDLKEVCRERDKALQELTRLKQHLLDKVTFLWSF